MRNLLSLAILTLMTTSAPAVDNRCYELRTYYAAAGKLDDLHARFRNHTLKLFEKHGMENIGYWVPLDNPHHKLIYVLAHANRDAAKKSWTGFIADPDWTTVVKASEANGKLVSKIESTFLNATDYGPAIKSSTGNESRTFELRTYTASRGNLDALQTRFRDHTVKLFSKHGMEHIGYWTLMTGQPGAENTLLYILAHKSPEASAASFKSFRADPDWLKAKEASENKVGGSLTEGGMAGVKSLLMKATDYSPTK